MYKYTTVLEVTKRIIWIFRVNLLVWKYILILCALFYDNLSFRCDAFVTHLQIPNRALFYNNAPRLHFLIKVVSKKMYRYRIPYADRTVQVVPGEKHPNVTGIMAKTLTKYIDMIRMRKKYFLSYFMLQKKTWLL